MGTTGRFKRAPALTIADGDTESNVLPSTCIEDLTAVLLYGPPTLDGATTYGLEVHYSPDATGATSGWVQLCDGTGSQLEAPGAAKAQLYTEIPHAGAFRIVASGAVGADRTWRITGIETV